MKAEGSSNAYIFACFDNVNEGDLREVSEDNNIRIVMIGGGNSYIKLYKIEGSTLLLFVNINVVFYIRSVGDYKEVHLDLNNDKYIPFTYIYSPDDVLAPIFTIESLS